VFHFDGGALKREAISSDELGYGLVSLAQTPEGIFAGGWGRILRRSAEGSWDVVSGVPPNTLISAMTGYRGSLVYAGRAIAREVKLDASAECSDISLADSGQERWHIAELGDGALVIAGARFDRELGIEMTKVALLQPL